MASAGDVTAAFGTDADVVQLVDVAESSVHMCEETSQAELSVCIEPSPEENDGRAVDDTPAADDGVSDTTEHRSSESALGPDTLDAIDEDALRRLLWNGDVGDTLRASAWKRMLLGGITLQAKIPQDCYETLCQTASSYDSAIRRDIGRTLPQEERFRDRNGPGQEALFKLLRALSTRLWDVGYCQSLNFIGATMISVFPEDEARAFDCVLALLLRYSLVDFFRPQFPKLGVIIWQFDRIVEGFLPNVHAALEKNGVNSEYYGIQWFLTLFASELDQAIVRRIWDRFLVAGWQVVVQIGLALLYKVQDVLHTMDACHMLSFLRRFVRTSTYDVDDLLRTALSFQISHQMLSSIEAAYDWEGEVELLAVKDLNTSELHWAVQSVPQKWGSRGMPTGTTTSSARAVGVEASVEENVVPTVPRAFIRANSASASAANDIATKAGDGKAKGSVLPFLIHDLDTGRTAVMERAWSQYVGDVACRARACSLNSAMERSTSDGHCPTRKTSAQTLRSVGNGHQPLGTPCSARAETERLSTLVSPFKGRDGVKKDLADGGGSFWTQSMRRQAAQRLNSG
eukprot:TRINITY_DN49979_c0_g1_i1.p1 TRINITY_DN49979_c0_g1~~TRINITY_DN49979_c0_g1_i1.p1  ORF type:complete len:583 (-),score=97.04 TRINITY_DN49979_c0_g1_i1:123-1835(-)